MICTPIAYNKIKAAMLPTFKNFGINDILWIYYG